MRRTLLVLAAPLAIGLSTAASAQTSQRLSIQGSGLYAALFGTAFDDIKDGKGGELQLRFTPGAWSFGGGVQFTKHSTAGDANTVIPNVKLLGLFFEPRRVIDIGSSSYAPYLSARLAYSRMTFGLADEFKNDPDVGVEIGHPTGPTVNVGGGVLIRLSSRANLDLGVTFGYAKYSDIELAITDKASGDSETENFKVGSGKNAVIRAGFAIGIGK